MPRGGQARPAVLVFLLLAALSVSLALRASLQSPKGTVFVGTFYYHDDFYNYLSYVEQAERGELVFRNKLAPFALPPVLVNLEWLGVGWLSALLGGAPLLAYRIAGLVALAGLVLLSDRWLVRSGLPRQQRLPALLLVFTGGGLGGVLFALGLLPGERALDVRTGAFPLIAALANPHFVIGTALLTGALGLFAAGRVVWGVALGTVLGLVRPYDAALLAGIEGLAVLVREPVRAWPRRLLPVAALVPVLAYNAWLFRASAGFKTLWSPLYGLLPPGPLELGVALGPAFLIAITALRAERLEPASAHRLRLLLWALTASMLVLLHPVSFSLQFIVGIGVPLLVLGAVGLATLPGWVLPAVVPAMAASSLVAAWLCTIPSRTRNAPEERWRVAEALGTACRPGDVAIAPADIGLYIGGLTPCWPFLSHVVAPEHEARAEAVRRFYGEATPAERAGFLEESCAAFVVLPPSVPAGWLGGAPFRPRLEVPGPLGGLAVFERDPATPCRGAP